MNNFNIAGLMQATRAVAAPVRLPAPRIVGRTEGASSGCYAVAMDDQEYHHGTPGVSSTHLKKLMRSPAHYRAWLEGRSREDTPARRFGRAVHCRVLEPDAFDDRYVVWKGERRGADFREFETRHAGRTILTEDELGRVRGCEEALLSEPGFPLEGYLKGIHDDDGKWLVEPAKTEFTIVWVDEPTGVTCKVRLDAVAFEVLIAVDVKTCGDARPAAFTRDIANLHYDLQAAFYMEGLRRYTGREETFVLAAVESEAPHGVAFYSMGAKDDWMINGTTKYRYALDRYARCMDEGCWPKYGYKRVLSPELAPWMTFENG